MGACCCFFQIELMISDHDDNDSFFSDHHIKGLESPKHNTPVDMKELIL